MRNLFPVGGSKCSTASIEGPAGLEFLAVDRFLQTPMAARALTAALDLKLLELLRMHGPIPRSESAHRLHLPSASAALLFNALIEGGVLAEADDGLALTPAFIQALRYRDLLQARIDLWRLAGTDLHEDLTILLADPDAFMARSRTFAAFRYDRCFELTAENRQATWAWVRITSTLSKYESGACVGHPAFAEATTMLDIGGNSGEFALQACRRHPGLTATVIDLPLVCSIGREHLAHRADAERVRFQSGDARVADLGTAEYDLVTFKSFLHDWPDRDAAALMARGSDALRSGGTLLIFERGPIDTTKWPLPCPVLSHLPFMHCYREADFYCERLRSLGFVDVEVQSVMLEMTFNIITGRKP